jgi:thioredoxin-dependent peroxiredoxin
LLQTGSIAPDFTLSNEAGGETSLSDLLRTGPLVLYFYPADFTPGCTREACDIRDMHADIVAAGLRVVGVSPQDKVSHERFRDEHQLPFQLLSDPDKSVIRQYDVDGPFGVGVRRATYLISSARRIQAAVQADFMIRRHKEFIRKAIALHG